MRPISPRDAPTGCSLSLPREDTGAGRPFRFPRWVWALALASLCLGLGGLTGSSGWAESERDPLLDVSLRSSRPEILGRSRAIRGDEFVVEAPLERSQQLARPSFPLVNPDQGLGQLQRNAYLVPTLDWGLAFRPLAWPLLIPWRWALGVRWYLRTALLILGLFAWFRVLSTRQGDEHASGRDDVVAGLCAAAVLFSSAFSWWMSTSLTETIAFAGLGVGAVERRRTARGPRRHAWLALAGWLFTCAFFAFYAPSWGPTLWVVCGAVADLAWRRTRSIRASVREIGPVIAVVAAGVVVAIVYYAPYIVAVAGTVYPGHRQVPSGDFPMWRLLHMGWPSLTAFAPPRSGEVHLGLPGSNVCESSALEVLPLFVLAALAVLDGPVRSAVSRAVAGSPGLTVALLVLLAWMVLPLPPGLAAALLMRWTPTVRAFFTFGFAMSLLVAAALFELQDEPATGTRRRDALIAAAVLLVTYVAARSWVVGRLGGRSAFLHFAPMVLFTASILGAVWTLGRGAGAIRIAASWAIPVVMANFFVNPVIRTRDLFKEGTGHQTVSRALEQEPGRIVHYWTHSGSFLNGFGWPMLLGVEQAPDVHMFRYLAPEVPGLTEDVFNRYAHVLGVFPPEPTRILNPDSMQIALSPCSRRLATLGVNHFLAPATAQLPASCAADYVETRAGDLLLWSRREPVGDVGVGRSRDATTVLAFDFRREHSPAGWRVDRLRDGFEVTVSGPRPIAIATNLSLVDRVECVGARARALDAHLLFETSDGGVGRCRVDYLASLGALGRLTRESARQVAPSIEFVSR